MSQAEEGRAKRAAARLSIAAAAFLITLKLVTGWMTGSISVWASLLDSAMDILASLINFVAVRAASRPPDKEYAYGHGKAESLAGLLQAFVIAASGFFLIREAVLRLLHPHATSFEWLGVVTMAVAALISLLLVRRLRRTARTTDSPALQADAAHYISDVYTNTAALLALLITLLTGWLTVDPIFSIAISLYIVWTAVDVARESIDVLMDRRLPPEIDQRVADIVGRFRDQGVVGFHDLRTRRSGSYKFIDLHLEVQRDQSLEEAHDLTVRVIRTLEREIPRARIQVHTDPA